jgi:hypothetical protein
MSLRLLKFNGGSVDDYPNCRSCWGAHRQTARPAADWIEVPAASLQIVAAELWQAAHDRLDAARAIYLTGTQGRAFGRSAVHRSTC